jgi:hypothetical protein
MQNDRHPDPCMPFTGEERRLRMSGDWTALAHFENPQAGS